MTRPLISIVIPTYNAESTLALTLRSIREQTVSQDDIEILCVDGGSTDSTRDIATKYGAQILDNPKRLPEFAKHIGLLAAKGHYLIRQDADEVYTNNNQLKKRLKLLKEHPDVKCLHLDKLISPDQQGAATSYINLIGDPFTSFVYQSKTSFCKTFKKNRIDNSSIFKFSSGDILPIGDGGTTMINLDFVHDTFSNKIHDQSFASTVYNDIVHSTGLTACIEGDNILHYASASVLTYLKKLRFRVINNIHDTKGSGYSARATSNNKLKIRKFLFPLYCLLLPWPIFEGFSLAIKERNTSFLLHPFYAWYVLFLIAYELTKSKLGMISYNKSYGK